jgi:hypothetical protein
MVALVRWDLSAQGDVRRWLRKLGGGRMRTTRIGRGTEEAIMNETPGGAQDAQDEPKGGELRESDVTAEDRLDEGDLSEAERLPGDERSS